MSLQVCWLPLGSVMVTSCKVMFISLQLDTFLVFLNFINCIPVCNKVVPIYFFDKSIHRRFILQINVSVLILYRLHHTNQTLHSLHFHPLWHSLHFQIKMLVLLINTVIIKTRQFSLCWSTHMNQLNTWV